jgi:filamentous hemagglutinin family protein
MSHISKKVSLPLFLINGVIFSCLVTTNLVRAQVTLDGTLPTKVGTSDNRNFTITDGTQLGGNLFHSFREFSVPNGGSVIFANGWNVQNIFSRVTGNSISKIEGLIQTNGNANLFLINPNGIIFGTNAQLMIGGSFIASTASQINFADGSAFSATDRQTDPLLTVSMPIGLQFREKPGNIINRSTANNGNGLEVPSGQTLALVGGNVFLEGGVLTTTGGRIEVGSVAAPAVVNLTPITTGWALDYNGVQNFQDIQLSKNAVLQTNLLDTELLVEGSGDIVLQGRQITVSGKSEILGNNDSKALGGMITVKASESLKINEDSDLSTKAFSPATGTSGDIIIATKRLIVRDNDSFIDTATESDGRGGNLTINATESVDVDAGGGFNQLTTQTFGNGDAGTLQITTGRLILRNGGQLSSSTSNVGNGGKIIISAFQSIEASGQGIFVNEIIQSGVFARTKTNEATGNGGSISIDTGRLVVQDGASISVAAVRGSTGQAGSLNINASESVVVSGADSSLLATSESLKPAGNLTVETGKINVSDGATVSVSSPQGQAGNLRITANSLTLNRGSITAETGKSGAEGANISLQIADQLTLSNESLISATAKGDANGGNIDINTQFLIAFPPTGPDGSDIIAKADRGNGGNIKINAQGIFGIAKRLAIPGDQTNDINASSQFGASGQVQINSTIDPNQGITQLPETVVDPNTLVAQNPCKRGSQSQFSRTGRGGLPPSLNEDLSSEATQVGLVEPAPMVVGAQALPPEQTGRGNAPVLAPGASSEIAPIENPSPPTPTLEGGKSKIQNPIVPAQGWIFNDKGEVVLTAYNPNVTGPQRLKENPAGCPAP